MCVYVLCILVWFSLLFFVFSGFLFCYLVGHWQYRFVNLELGNWKQEDQ